MVSCIITTYKREILILKRAIDSIKRQTYKDIEIIIVNDAPEEKELCIGIEKMLKENYNNIIYIVHEKNSGACAARNTGIEASKGDYIAFLDDDDEWIDNKLEIQLKKIESDNSAMVYCDQLYIDSDGNEIYKKPSLEYLIGDTDFERLLCFNFIGSTSFPLIRSSVLKSVGGFNENLKSSQDHEVWLKIAKENKISYIPKALVRYYFSDVAITRSTKNREQGYTYLLKEFSKEYNNNKNLLHRRYILLSITYLGMKCFKQGFMYWRKAVILNPLSLSNFMIFERYIKKILKK